MDEKVDAFVASIMRYYAENVRDLPWRRIESNGTIDPYKILVSEVMLQQTQVMRVLPKYEIFLEQFPDIQTLAAAQLSSILRVWSGLGYNRRAKFIRLAAQKIVESHGGNVPRTLDQLIDLPGIGRETAGAILVYSFNEPVAFVETNVRTAVIHHFFTDEKVVSDSSIRPLIEKSLVGQDPRVFYWALMDYGHFLKSSVGNKARQSKSYSKQTRFEGSKRELRGHILRLLTLGPQTISQLSTSIADARLSLVLAELEAEEFIRSTHHGYAIAE